MFINKLMAKFLNTVKLSFEKERGREQESVINNMVTQLFNVLEIK